MIIKIKNKYDMITIFHLGILDKWIRFIFILGNNMFRLLYLINLVYGQF